MSTYRKPLDYERLMTPEEVAWALGCHPKTVTRWAKKGLLPEAARTLGGHRRWKRADIEAYLARQDGR